MKKIIVATLFIFCGLTSKEQWLAGGNMHDETIGPSWCAVFGCNLQAHRITLKIFSNDSTKIPLTARIFVWDNTNGYLWAARDQPLDHIEKLRELRYACVLGDSLNYWVGFYLLTVDLAPN